MQLQIEYVPIDSIKPYEGNAKEHPEYQIQQIAESIDGFDFLDPIGIWHGEIVEGHGRYIAAKRLGFTEIPVIRLDELTNEQRRAYGLIHNQLTMNSGFDLDALPAELEKLEDFELDMSDFGFELPEMFSIDDIEDNMDVDEDESEYWTTKLTFPKAKKKQVSAYLREHKEDICREIIKRSEE